jgi:hypothetical protein
MKIVHRRYECLRACGHRSVEEQHGFPYCESIIHIFWVLSEPSQGNEIECPAHGSRLLQALFAVGVEFNVETGDPYP